MRESSQRLLALFRGERVAQPPLWEAWFAMHDLLKERYENSYIAMADELGHAAVPIPSPDTNVMFLAKVERTEAGAFYGGGTLRDPQQLADKPEPDYAEQLPRIMAARQTAADAGIACWLVLGWCFDRVAASMGLEQFALDCYDRPEFLAEAMQWVEARNRHAVEQIVRIVRPDFVLYNGDCAYRTGLMVNSNTLRDLCFEPTKQTVEMVRDLDIPFAFHSDGKLDDLIPMLVELGICAVHGCEKQANDLAHLVERFGDAIVLCGNMDVVYLTEATPADIQAETRRMIDVGATKARYVAGCNTSPMNYVPHENYFAFCQAVTGHGIAAT